MVVMKCKMCGGNLEFSEGDTTGVCMYCGTKQTLPKLDNDRRANLYDRAGHYRRANEFDKAEGLYEQILAEDTTDAEAYWSLVLCRYGIEYVEDPNTHKRVPTVNRVQYTSIYDDDNYKAAIENADAGQRYIYEEEAGTINEIQKGILDISNKEEPFDVFISYKETDDSTHQRTRDSVLAGDIYHQLTKEGLKVFYSKITLENKLGSEYEPYIFAALNSAKVMLVVGTKPEYFNAPWVKNEWSRYLKLIKERDGGKTLIPAYRDMDPYDLPEEFSHLQAQDMSKIGFMQDIIRGIDKIVRDEPHETVVKEVTHVAEASVSVENLLKRVFMFLEDGDFNEANAYCERVLDQEPENAKAYLGKLMAELHVRRQEDLARCITPLSLNKNYNKVLRFGDDKLSSPLKEYEACTRELYNGGIYEKAVSDMNKESNEEKWYLDVAEKFRSISGYKDSDALAAECFVKAEEHRKAKEEAEAERRRKEEEERKAKEDEENRILSIANALKGDRATRDLLDNYLRDWRLRGKVNNILKLPSDYIMFGRYIQKVGGATEPIVWCILKTQDDRMLLLSRDALDFRQFHWWRKTIGWKDCTLRKWLNGEFSSVAFSQEEQNRIISSFISWDYSGFSFSEGTSTDKVFLLSTDEYIKYRKYDFPPKCFPTQYALSKAEYREKSAGKPCSWWLRDTHYDCANFIYYDGSLEMRSVNGSGTNDCIGTVTRNDIFGIRPAMWISI